MRTLKIPAELRGNRLDAVLAKIDSKYSRASWQKLIKAGQIKVKSVSVTDPSWKVTAQSISVQLPNKPQLNTATVPIIFQDRDVLVLNKPEGMLTHAKGQLADEPTLADFVRPLIDDDGSNRPGIVHRLDRGTSGVIIVAKSLEANRFLQTQFSRRKVIKSYRALVHGIVVDDQALIDLPIARNPKRPASFMAHPGGKSAQTDLKVIIRSKDTTLVEMQPATGRTHQLRVHLSHIGYPVVGDAVYGRPDSAKRMCLHAHTLRLQLPSGEVRTFTAAVPASFTAEVNRSE